MFWILTISLLKVLVLLVRLKGVMDTYYRVANDIPGELSFLVQTYIA